MKRLNIIFRVHHPFQLRRYRFFDIGREHYYFDDFANQNGIEKLAQRAYLPLNGMMLRNLQLGKGKLKASFYLSGSAIELFGQYAPQVIASFSELQQTGNVEFLGGTWAHSLSSAYSKPAFREEVIRHRRILQKYFNVHPTSFFNGELLYSDDIGATIHSLGFESTIAEGSRHLLGWRSPDMLYANTREPALKILMLNPERTKMLSFSNNRDPISDLTPEALIEHLEHSTPGDQSVTLLFDYEMFAGQASGKNGWFEFLNRFLTLVSKSEHLVCSSPAETIAYSPPVSLLGVPHPAMYSGIDPQHSLFPGNELQTEALQKLYTLAPTLRGIENDAIQLEWLALQSSDHFRYMSNRWFEQTPTSQLNPWTTAHEAFINFMNIVSDFSQRVGPKGKNRTASKADKLERKVKRQQIQLEKYKLALHKLNKQKDNPASGS